MKDRTLFGRPLSLVWAVLTPLIILCYLFVDRPACDFINDHHWQRQLFALAQLTANAGPSTAPHDLQSNSLINSIADWPPLVTGFAPLLMLLALAFPQGKIRRLLTAIGISVLFTFLLKNDLKWVFSRYWPLTWTHNNVSWITHHAYGFQWFQGKIFQGGDTTGSFPSGHTAIAFSSLLPIGMFFRKTLPWCILLGCVEGTLMVVFNYHFVSDVLAGALIGVSCAFWTQSLMKTEHST